MPYFLWQAQQKGLFAGLLQNGRLNTKQHSSLAVNNETCFVNSRNESRRGIVTNRLLATLTSQRKLGQHLSRQVTTQLQSKDYTTLRWAWWVREWWWLSTWWNLKSPWKRTPSHTESSKVRSGEVGRLNLIAGRDQGWDKEEKLNWVASSHHPPLLPAAYTVWSTASSSSYHAFPDMMNGILQPRV